MTCRPVQSFELICDRCATQFEDGDYTIFVDFPADEARDADWWIGADWPPLNEGPHYCSGCHEGDWSDDGQDRVLISVKPVPGPHAFVRDPRYTSEVFPGEWCKAEGCGLMAKHDVHQGGGAS